MNWQPGAGYGRRLVALESENRPMTTSKHIAIYVRVSTTGQDHASQMPDLEKWAAGQEDPVVWYKDKFTGRQMERPGMSRLLDALHSGKISQIVIWRLDRLGRTARGLCHLFDDLRAHKVDLVSLRDGFSLNTASGRLHARILASVAEFENEVRSERIRAGQAAAKDRGVKWGGSEKGWTYKVTHDQEKAILKMIKEGVKKSKIARITGLSRPTIYRVIRNHEEGLRYDR